MGLSPDAPSDAVGSTLPAANGHAGAGNAAGGPLSPTGRPATTGLALELWQQVQHEVYMSLHDTFVQGLAQGTLDRRAFQHYVSQDAFFLQYFARAYGIALSKALALDEETFGTLSRLLRGVHEELCLHGAYAARWGVTLADCTPSAATLAYTDFLMEVAESGGQDGGVAEILAAMLPCSRLYGYLGCTLAAAHNGHAVTPAEVAVWGAGGARGQAAAEGAAPQHEYWSWVQTYSSPEYLAIPALKEALFERLAATADKGTLLRLYRRAMQLEAEFFAAQPHAPPPRRIAALAVDFDDTCTRRDSIGGLLRLSIAAAAAGRPTGGDAAWAERTVAELAANYVSRQRELLAELLPEGATPASTFDPDGLDAFLDKLSDFDEAMNRVVEDSRILAGSTAAEVLSAAQAVELRPQCRESLQGCLARGVPVHVVSVNWSDAYVGQALQLPTVLDAPEGSPPAAGVVHVRCNSLQVGPEGLTSGGLVKRVQGARDKRAAMLGLRRQFAVPSAPRDGLLVYVGDSASDLAALLGADVGIVVGANTLLRRVAARFGVRLRPLAAAPLDARAAALAASAGVLYEAAGWEEIRAFLFGVERPAPEQQRAGAGQLRGPRAAASTLPRVLSIAGSDSGGGAGIQADTKAMLSRGVFAMTAVTALTAQNTHGVSGVHVVPAAFLAQQIDAVMADLGADAIKTGMLPNAEAVELVAERVRHYRAAAAAGASRAASGAAAPGRLALVVDPVLVSTSGHSLAEGSVAGALLRSLLPLATLVTPNLPEAEALLGCEPITSVEDMKAAAKDLQARSGCGAVLVKGGHLKPGAGGDGAAPPVEAVDVLFDGERHHELRSPWVVTGNTHGTGCTLASAIAAELAKGLPLLPAIVAARAALLEALRASAPLSLGTGVQRPFHHLYMLPPAALGAAQPAAAAGRSGAGAHASGRVDAQLLRRQLRLYAVTDPHCNAKCNRSLLEAVSLAVRGGATVVQLREKDADGGAFAKVAAEALKVCRAHGVPLIINDRVDVALAVGADGVHVGQSDLPAEVVRALIGPTRILGVSVKTPAEARAAAAAGADYLGAGAVLPTGTKDTAVIGLGGLAAVCSAAAPLPVVAIGGLAASNAAGAIASGAAGVAVVSAIFAAEDVEGAARTLRAALDCALSAEAE